MQRGKAKTIDNLDFGKLSIDDLNRVIAKAQKEIEKKQKASIQELRSELEKIAKNRTGMSVEEVYGFSAKKRKAKAPGLAKYRNPKNADQTWTGRGKRPRWMQEIIASGGKLEDALIK